MVHRFFLMIVILSFFMFDTSGNRAWSSRIQGGVSFGGGASLQHSVPYSGKVKVSPLEFEPSFLFPALELRFFIFSSVSVDFRLPILSLPVMNFVMNFESRGFFFQFGAFVTFYKDVSEKKKTRLFISLGLEPYMNTEMHFNSRPPLPGGVGSRLSLRLGLNVATNRTSDVSLFLQPYINYASGFAMPDGDSFRLATGLGGGVWLMLSILSS